MYRGNVTASAARQRSFFNHDSVTLIAGSKLVRADPQADIRRLLLANQYRPFIQRIDEQHSLTKPLHRPFDAFTDENPSIEGPAAIGERS